MSRTLFMGHYGVSLAAKRVDARLSLGSLFLAVQLPDILWAMLFWAWRRRESSPLKPL